MMINIAIELAIISIFNLIITFVKQMRKVTGIALIGIFILYICGIQLIYSLKLSVAKNQASYVIGSHKVQLNNTRNFSFTHSQYGKLNWSERNKEFIYNGRHYDIISMEFNSDEIKVICFDDSNETTVMAEFAGFMKKMFSQGQSTNDNNSDIANKICKEYLPNENLTPTYFFHVVTTIRATCVLVNQHALVADVWHPPSIS